MVQKALSKYLLCKVNDVWCDICHKWGNGLRKSTQAILMIQRTKDLLPFGTVKLPHHIFYKRWSKWLFLLIIFSLKMQFSKLINIYHCLYGNTNWLRQNMLQTSSYCPYWADTKVHHIKNCDDYFCEHTVRLYNRSSSTMQFIMVLIIVIFFICQVWQLDRPYIPGFSRDIIKPGSARIKNQFVYMSCVLL